MQYCGLLQTALIRLTEVETCSLTQIQFTELVGTHHPWIARLESGQSHSSLSFLQQIAEVLHARIE